MLLTKEQVVAAMSLDYKAVCAAIEVGGYDSAGVLDADFLGMEQSGLFVYRIVFDGEDGTEDARVYISYKREALSNRIYLQAEY